MLYYEVGLMAEMCKMKKRRKPDRVELLHVGTSSSFICRVLTCKDLTRGFNQDSALDTMKSISAIDL